MRKTIKVNGKVACDIIKLINSCIPDSYEKMEYPSGSKIVEVTVLDQNKDLTGKGGEVFEVELDRDWFDVTGLRRVLEKFSSYLSASNYDAWWMDTAIEGFLDSEEHTNS